MLSKFKIVLYAALLLSLILLASCSKDKSTTPPSVPVLTTVEASGITRTTAECGGVITSDGGGAVTARGVCWSTSITPTIADSKTSDGTGTGIYSSLIAGLTGRSLYYFRAYATNSVGTGYGDILSFTTTDSNGTVTDIDGNTYRTIKIGNQWWMAENLKVTHYRNGITIPIVADSASWSGQTSGAYCNINNDASQVAIYGRLYNWYAINDSSVIAPAGWHVASDSEWQTLVDFLGGDAVAGGKMKETGTTHWITPNVGATNESGFSALPGGFRYDTGNFYGFGAHGNFWSSTAAGGNVSWYRFLHCTNAGVARYSSNITAGFSIRCVKD
jgi:uncharacterized protein (TIGR02145 family)